MNDAPLDDAGEWLRIEHRHPPGTVLVVVAVAAVLAWYAAWLTADLGLGTPAFAVVGAAAAYGLYRQPSRGSVVVAGLYALAAMLVVTPVFMNLPFLLAAGAYGVSDPVAFTVRLADVVFLVVFTLLATVPAGLAWGLSQG